MAISDFNTAISKVEEKNHELDEIISVTQSIVDSGETPYDMQSLTDAKEAITFAEEMKREIPSISTEGIEEKKRMRLLRDYFHQRKNRCPVRTS